MSEFKHNGLPIVYDEFKNEWRCEEYNIVAASLAAVRKRIDEMGREDRPLNVQMLMIDTGKWKNPQIVAVKVTTICEPSRFSSRECWVSYGKKQRSKVKIDTLYLPEARPALEDWVALQMACYEAEKTAIRALKDIPAATAEQLIEAANGNG